jgi:hypothetical protein
MLLSPAAPADDVRVSIGIGLPHASIGIHLGEYPRLVAVPGYPVYYAPRVRANFFFYDGMYWVFANHGWYASYFYDGPWWYVDPFAVPVYILRVPVRYYRHPPPYFRAWRRDAPPRWGDHWGREWEHRRSGWDRWNRRAVPPLAPLPAYQRRYSGDSYPRQAERQREIHGDRYRYQPREPVVRQHYQGRYQERAVPRPPAQPGRPNVQDRRRPPSQPGMYPREQREQREIRERRDQQMQRSQGRDDRQQGRGANDRGRDERGRDQERGRGRND